MSLNSNEGATVWQVIESADPTLGGTTRAAVEVALGLAGLGVRSALVAKRGLEKLQADGEIASRLVSAGVRICPSTANTSLSKFLSSDLTPGDLVHLHGVWEPCLWRVAKVARRRNIPYIVFPHGMLTRWSLRRSFVKKRVALAAGARRMLSKANVIQCLTEEELADIALLRLPAKLVKISNGVQFPAQAPDPGEFYRLFPHVPQGERLLVFMGRIHPKKGLLLVLEALQAARMGNPNWTLVIAGAAEDLVYESRCRTLAQRMPGQIFWLGHVTGSTKLAVLSAADVFLLTSFQEGFSLAVLEALSMGVPVIISKQCSFPQVEAVEAGLIVDTVSQEIAWAITTMLAKSADELRAAGLRGQQLVGRHYTWSSVLAQLLLTYRQLGASV